MVLFQVLHGHCSLVGQNTEMEFNASEKENLAAICEYLYYKNYFFYRNNNVPIFDTKTSRYRSMPKFTPKGLPDIVVVRLGIYIGLEVKSTKGIPSDEQVQMKQRIELAGGKWYCVRSVHDLQIIGL